MSVPKKHHYVPQFLLRNFADDRGQLIVHRTDQQREYGSNVRDLGHRNLGHSLFWPNREPDHASLESMMADIESAAATAVGDLRAIRTRTVSADQREVLSFLIALQWTRSRFVMIVVRRDVLGRDTPMDESNRSLGLLNIVASVLDPWAARKRGAHEPKERFCSIESLLAGWGWRVYRPRGQPLVVADNVVSMWGVAAGAVSSMPEAWTRHGMGVGFGNCARITVPLAPDLGLVLTPRGQTPRRIGTAEFNRATIYNSREFVAHHPAWQPGQFSQRAFDEDVFTQRWILPMILEGSTSDRQQGTSGVLPDSYNDHGVARA
jgi:Protein of unknown function (DUF4238)